MMVNKTMRTAAAIILIAVMVLTGMTVGHPQIAAAAGSTTVLRVLEVQPGPVRSTDNGTMSTEKYLLDPSYSDGTYTYKATQMTMNHFISSIDEINGQYDIVYIGEYFGTYKAEGSTFGTFQGSKNETYSGVDITNRRAEMLLDFIDSGQPTFFTDTIFNSTKSNTKLYKNFYKENPKASTKPVYNKIFKVSSNITKSTLYSEMKKQYIASKKRPTITLVSQPKAYDGTQQSYEKNNAMSFAFDLNNPGKNNMDVTLYVDVNGDGIFKDVVDKNQKITKQEVVAKLSGVSSGEGYTLNWPLPGNYTGVLPWKIVVRDRTTGAQDYQTGYAAYNSSGKMTINVLQLYPNGNTLDLSTLKDDKGKNMLDTNEYKINIDMLSVREFNKNPDKYELNGKYDMVILGFADMYGTKDDDITNAKAIRKIKDYIASGQSVMFTHDTLTFEVANTTGWGRNITREFRTMIGQDIYEGTTDKRYGFSWLTLTRAKKGDFPRSNDAVKLNDALVTNYPYILGNIKVSQTHHQYFQLNLEDEDVVPFYTLSGSNNGYTFDSNDGRNDYYTYSKGNITYSGTGHVKPGDYLTEKQLFVNTMVKAIRGANHAPVVSVSGIQDGQYVDVGTGLSFDFMAEDFDGEQTLDVQIFVDKKNNGEFTLVKSYLAEDKTAVLNGESRSEKLLGLTIPTKQTFAVKIVATDAHGAQGMKTVTLVNERPNLALMVPVANGYLVGDKADLSYKVICQDIGALSNIKLWTDINTVKNSNSEVGIYAPPSNGWYTSGNELAHSVAGTQDLTLQATFNKPGNYQVNNRFTYDTYSAQGLYYTANSFTANVKSAALNISVSKTGDNGIAKGVKDVPVQVKNKATGVVYYGTTGSSGFVRLQTGGTDNKGSMVILPSGTYDITIIPPVGYEAATGNTQTATLNYGNPEKAIEFNTTGSIVNSVKFDKAVLYTVSNGFGKALLSFNLRGDVKHLSMDLKLPDYVQGKINYTAGKLKDAAGNSYNFTVEEEKMIFPASEQAPLKAGSYEAEFTIKVANTVPVGEYPLVVSKATYRDRYLTYKDSEYENLDLNAEVLNINVLSKPKLQ